jgi:hypothetical protein
MRVVCNAERSCDGRIDSFGWHAAMKTESACRQVCDLEIFVEGTPSNLMILRQVKKQRPSGTLCFCCMPLFVCSMKYTVVKASSIATAIIIASRYAAAAAQGDEDAAEALGRLRS